MWPFNKRWFRIEFHDQVLEGRKVFRGNLELTWKVRGGDGEWDMVSTLLPVESAQQLSDWLGKVYPQKSAAVLKLSKGK